MKNRFYLLVVITTLVTLITVFYFISIQNETNSKQFNYLDNKEYETKVNKWLEEKQLVLSVNNQNRTPEREKAKNDRAMRMIEVGKARVKDINFFGKVVDQYGEPVQKAMVTFSAHSGYLAEGTGTSTVETNSTGSFEISDAGGVGLTIKDIKKQGYLFKAKETLTFYSFKRFADSRLWSDHDQNNPLVLKLWKIEEYPKVKRSKTGPRSLYGFIPDGREYTLDFLKNSKSIKHEGLKDGDIVISMTHSNDDWTLTMRAIDGGLQESDDDYLFLAPEYGYKNELVFSNNKEADRLKKNIFFVSRNQNYYGLLSIDVFPYYRKKSAIDIRYVINLENDRNLLVPNTN